MTKRYVTILIILSFITPSLHFLKHHSYNPFTHSLEHNQHYLLTSNVLDIISTVAQSAHHHDETDSCDVTPINQNSQLFCYKPHLITTVNNHSIYLTLLFKKDLNPKRNDILHFAPKHSPPSWLI